jgi:predicted phage baseplate assembly protein
MTNDCRTDRRRAKIRSRHRNGVDGVEVSDDGRTLTVTFLGRAPRKLGPENIRIDGGRRIRGIVAVDVVVERQEDPELDDRVRVTVDRSGDNSTYTLSVVEPDAYGFPGTTPYPDFDPRYASADFDFRQMCPTELDCAAGTAVAPAARPQPLINYTARDYASLRKLLLDRMTLTVPDWTERHVPDLGVTLAEVMAYVGDQLSYYQDAVATEAYLDTARRRTSVRRHARLIDYAMHDGCNARTFVTVEACHEATLQEGDFRFVAVDFSHMDPLYRPELGTVVAENELAELSAGYEVFEPVGAGDMTILPAHNEIRFWTWGDEECCLVKGATSATLRDEWIRHDDETDEESSEAESSRRRRPKRRSLRLQPGDVLIIEEVVGPGTGAAADADPANRQAVRLVTVTQSVDDLYDQPVVEVTWDVEDALTFSVCLSTRGGQDCCLISDVSVARGNVVLVDHGRDLTACGGAPEVITVPPAEIVAPTCAPPEFGCPGGELADPVVALVNDLISRTGDRESLTVEHVRALAASLGEDVTTRAGIVLDLDGEREVVLPDTTEDQHAALRTLLAQVTYPAVRKRFRPVLQNAPVTQRVPFPLSGRVAAGQARLLDTIPNRARERIEELWRQVRGGKRLTREQIGELTVLFGERTLRRLRITDRPTQALRELLARRTELLATKIRRLDVLRVRALAGGVLDHGIVWELSQSWGQAYVAGLAPGSPVLQGSAQSALATDPRLALPSVTVRSDSGPAWTARRDLLDSGPRDRHFVGEIAESGQLTLRFGDGRHGAAPPPGAKLHVTYRVGNGLAGNVGAEAINHIVLCHGKEHDAVERVRNPLVAVGGAEPETLDEVRQLAPLNLRRELLRAVTPEDYATLAAKVPGVQRAAAQGRWTGAGKEIRVAIDPIGQNEPSGALLAAVTRELAQVRRIGHQVTVGPAELVPLEIELWVCVAQGYQHGHVLRALQNALGNNGFFHPDALTFGEPVRVSRLVAAASTVPGVLTARVTVLRRQFGQDDGELAAGLLSLGPLEIAQLDNDPDRPENGRLTIVLGRA